MTTEINPQPLIEDDDEIDLIALQRPYGKVVQYSSNRSLFLASSDSLSPYLLPKEYIARTVMVPQIGDGQSKLGGLSSLAAMAGFNISSGSTGSDLSPTIYPQIIASIPFQLEMMNTPLKFKESANPSSPLRVLYQSEQTISTEHPNEIYHWITRRHSLLRSKVKRRRKR